MIRRTRLATLGTAIAIAITGALAVAGSASAATNTYRNDVTVFNPVDFPGPDTSGIIVQAGLPPVEKLELVGVKLSATNPIGLDADLSLTGPAGTVPPFDLLSDACTAYDSSAPINFTDGAVNTVGGVNCSGDLKPEDARTLALFNGSPSSGTWTATVVDDNGAAMTNFSFFGWGMKISHAPLTIAASGKKQALSKKVRFTATCNANCNIRTTGDVKVRSIDLLQNTPRLLKLPLKQKARNRLEDGGKAKINLSVIDAISDRISKTLKIKILG